MKEEQLLKMMESQVKYLSSSFKIPGMEKEDIAQELRVMLIEDFRKQQQKENINDDIYTEGWWFKRLKWHVQNLLEKEKKEPVNRSVRIETLDINR